MPLQLTEPRLACHSAESLMLIDIIAWGPQVNYNKLWKIDIENKQEISLILIIILLSCWFNTAFLTQFFS